MTRALTISDLFEVPAAPAVEHARSGLVQVKAEKLCKVIDERAILRDISMEICRGDFVARSSGPMVRARARCSGFSPPFMRPPRERSSFLAGGGEPGRRRSAQKIGLIAHQPMLYGDLTANREPFGGCMACGSRRCGAWNCWGCWD